MTATQEYENCDFCNKRILVKYHKETLDNRTICKDCIEQRGYEQCNECELYGDISNTMRDSDGEEMLVCPNCVDSLSFCGTCDLYYHGDDGVSDENTSMCNWCYEESYFICNDCERICSNDDYAEDGCCTDCRGSCEHGNHSLLGYHSGEGREDKSNGSRYRIGFEIEKEDRDVEIDAQSILDETGWAVEEDGSLDCYTGFEAVSPILDLMNSKAIHASLGLIKDLVNAKTSQRCGGHVHISDTQRPAGSIMRDIHGYLPLLYSMYPDRCNNDYCKVKPYREYVGSHDAFAITRNDFNNRQRTLEIRLFSSPKNIEQCMWRVELLQLMLTNTRRKPYRVIAELTDRRSKLYKLMRKVYSDRAIAKKINLLIKYATELELPSFVKDREKGISKRKDFNKKIKSHKGKQ